MAAKTKKRLAKTENTNKLQSLEKLELKDVICSICQSILIEPVTLPCYHSFCQRCFNGTVENNALCCPLCRLRIGSWLRTATKQKTLVNVKFWNFIKSKFAQEVNTTAKGGDVFLPEEKTIPRLSKQGEIKSEYEVEIKKLRAEREQLEQKQLQETQLFIKKLQEEENRTYKKYLERLKQDEILAKKLQQEQPIATVTSKLRKHCQRKDLVKPKPNITKPKLKISKIDNYLCKTKPVPGPKDSPLLTDDNSEDSVPLKTAIPSIASPEMVPRIGPLVKNGADKKVNTYDKENGDKRDEKVRAAGSKAAQPASKSKCNTKSLLVSLPLPSSGIIHHKSNITELRSLETGSVDSMRQELCYFKPIEKTPSSRGLPLRVPTMRPEKQLKSGESPPPSAPSRTQYLEGLCQLRNLSMANNLPSAFVIALSMLRVKKEIGAEKNNKLKNKKSVQCPEQQMPGRNVVNKSRQNNQVDDASLKISPEISLRRTRSMGSISKDENETTPRKYKIQDKKAASDRKPYLRSDSKKLNSKTHSPPSNNKTINNNRVNLAVKNLSSPFKNCDVKQILQEQLRIEKLIEQEKSDFELARKMEEEWNSGRRQLRRPAVKRQMELAYALRPAKKLKV